MHRNPVFQNYYCVDHKEIARMMPILTGKIIN